jgi:hypothetical protein
MRPFAVLVAFALLAAPSHAQVLKVALKDPKILKQYKSAVMNVDGEQVLVGEHKSGLTISATEIKYPNNANFELWIPDVENPKFCPYKVVKGEKSSAGGKTSIQIAGATVKSISYLIKEQSLWGLSQEYLKRLADIDGMKKQRDAASKGTQDWNRKQATLIQAMDRLKSWLDQTCFARAGEKYTKEIDKEIKAQKEAKDQRLANAKASIKMTPTPEEVAHAGKEAFGDSVVFHQQDSQHCRIIYKEEIGDERVKGLLEFAESVIDGFRVQFVDPYVAEDFKDYIPDGQFAEWFFGPDDVPGYKTFTNKFYGIQWEKDPHAEETLKRTMGGGARRGKDPSYCRFWRIGEHADLDGMIAHNIGHILVDIHYNQNRNNDTGAWLHEAVGNWISLEYLGRNSVTCVEFRDLEYAKKLLPEGEQSGDLLKGTADLYHRLALDKGRAIDALVKLKLVQFEDEDIAKAYSLFTFVSKSQGEKGQRWLRSCLNAEAQENTFLQQWRKKSEEIFGITNQDVFKWVDAEWKKFAEQQVGGPIKK